MVDRDTLENCQDQKDRRGFSANPNCPICHGLGYVHPLSIAGRPDYTRTINCHADGCIESQERTYMATEPALKEKGVSGSHSFQSFRPVLGAEMTLEAFKDIAFNPKAPPLLLIFGTTGNGKTHLANATVTELSKRGIDCRLWAVADLVSSLKRSIPENTTELLMTKLKELPALVMDDWGQNLGTEWEEQKLEEIVLARERDGLITIITSNLVPDDLPERVISRFQDRSEARMITNEAIDYRPLKRKKKG